MSNLECSTGCLQSSNCTSRIGGGGGTATLGKTNQGTACSRAEFVPAHRPASLGCFFPGQELVEEGKVKHLGVSEVRGACLGVCTGACCVLSPLRLPRPLLPSLTACMAAFCARSCPHLLPGQRCRPAQGTCHPPYHRLPAGVVSVVTRRRGVSVRELVHMCRNGWQCMAECRVQRQGAGGKRQPAPSLYCHPPTHPPSICIARPPACLPARLPRALRVVC